MLKRAVSILILLACAGLIWAKADPPIPANSLRIHYHRPDATYTAWTIYAFGDTTEPTDNFGAGPVQVTGTDSFGAYFDVGVTAAAQNVGLIIHNGNTKDPGPNEFVDPSTQGREFWAISGIALFYTSQPSLTAAGVPAGYARIHYYRADGQFANWTVYAFGDTTEPTSNFSEGPVFPTNYDSYGAYFDVSLKPSPQDLGFIVHNVNSGVKDPGPDMHLNVATYNQAWVISGDSTVYTTQPTAAQLLSSSFKRLQAYWIDRTTIAIQPQYLQPSYKYYFNYSPTASLQITNAGLTGGVSQQLTPSTTGLTAQQLALFPQLSSYALLQVPANTDPAVLAQALTGQIAISSVDATGAIKYVTGIQTAGVLDDLFYYSGSLGPTYGAANAPFSLKVWAPTAQALKVLLYNNQGDPTPAATVAMSAKAGVWSASIDPQWRDKYYLLDVTVYVPSLQQIVDNIVTDPYSVDLALNGVKSRFTDLSSSAHKPAGWDGSSSPFLRTKNEFSVYELHIRDFSANDASVPAANRGTYLAFSQLGTNGMDHLAKLAFAGLKAVHLLPSFHFASVNEDKSTWASPGDLTAYPPDGQQQQLAVAALQSKDGFNWGYDPVHYFAPEGSYAVNPDHRVSEYRSMVLGLHHAGLRVVQDMVFNHTTSSGQNPNSVLDEIVPAYYYRLDADGSVLNGSCCADTASEHRMMEKLMIDAVVQYAREYKIDGFRFDLMSYHFKANMQHIEDALNNLTLSKDGVDGSKIYVYGEGWQAAETANLGPGPNATQANLYGTGIGTFNDRIRDGIRGGGPFSNQQEQGFATGLLTDPSAYTLANMPDQTTPMLAESDWVRLGLAGNMRDFTFANAAGQVVAGKDVIYGGQPAGYTASPIESVNYCSVHDDQTLFDAIQLKAAVPDGSGKGDSIDLRTRRQMVAMSLIALGQGVPFFLAGDDLLRSKDMDRNSYDSGDWFNKLDFTYQSDNWGTGLPIASENQSNWPVMQPLLANPALKPGPQQIANVHHAFEEYLVIRNTSSLFHMGTLGEVQNNLHFLNNSSQTPGLIVMKLDANGGSYGLFRHMVVVFNATTKPVSYQNDSLKNLSLYLHPVQVLSYDAAVRQSKFSKQSGTLNVPALTTAVFVAF